MSQLFPAHPGQIDFVTVVFAAEVPLLQLQARSLARYMNPSDVNAILIVVNDRDGPKCTAAIEEILADYGTLGERVRILQPEDLIRPGTRLPDRLRQAYLRLLKGSRRHTGWRGNRGWACQQAFKLLAAQAVRAPYTVVLDAKNWLMKPTGAKDFIAPDGRPLTHTVQPAAKQRLWIEASFAALGGRWEGRIALPTTTPIVLDSAFFRQALQDLEASLGPLESFFLLSRSKATEFMLLFAIAEMAPGGWRTRFAQGLEEAATVFRTADAVSFDTTVARAKRGECAIFGVHRAQFARLDEAGRNRLAALLETRGLCAPGAASVFVTAMAEGT